MASPDSTFRRTLSGLAVALAGAFAAMAALPLIPQVSHDLGPATVTGEARIGAGQTVFVAPPLGTVSAATHETPVRLELGLSRIDVTALEKQISNGLVQTEMISQIEDDLRGLVIRLIMQILLGSAIAGLLVAAMLPRRRLGNFVWAAGGSCLVAAGVVGITIATFDDRAFEEPTFSGALTRAPEVLDTFQRGSASLDALSSHYENLAGRISELMSLTSLDRTTEALGEETILHVSDIHSNPLGLEIVKRLARTFEVDAVVDTGDLTSFGEPLETHVVSLLDNLNTPYYFVPGNHDSPANRVEIDTRSEAILLDQDTVNVGGVEILGWADPTFTADNDLTTEEGNDLRLAEAEEVAEETVALGPDVLAVHDVRLAEQAIGEVPLVLSGHQHERSLELRDGTLILSVGSAGATGLGSFLIETDLPYEAEVVHFRDGLPYAIDYVSFFGLGEEFEIDRDIIEAEGFVGS